MSDSFAPPYTITDTMIDRISRISNLLGKLSADGSLSRTPQLRKANRISSIHSSLAIENNTLTRSQVMDILEGKAVIGPYAEVLAVKNAGLAYDLLEELNPFDESDLLKAHGILMKGLVSDAGEFRAGAVGVYSGEQCIHLAPPAMFVAGQVRDLLRWARDTTVHPLIMSSVFHFELEFIHPFSDGNGRVGRLWQTLLLSTWEKVFVWIPIETLILGRQDEYYEALRQSGKEGKSTVFVEFMLETIEQALMSHQKKPAYDTIHDTIHDTLHDTIHDTTNDTIHDTINDTTNDTLHDTLHDTLNDTIPDTLESAVLMLIAENPKRTSQQLAEDLGKSRATISRCLARLKERQVLVRVGAKKNGYWKIQHEYIAIHPQKKR